MQASKPPREQPVHQTHPLDAYVGGAQRPPSREPSDAGHRAQRHGFLQPTGAGVSAHSSQQGFLPDAALVFGFVPRGVDESRHKV